MELSHGRGDAPKECLSSAFAARAVFSCDLEGFSSVKQKKTAILPKELFRQIKARTIELGCIWCPLWPLRRTKSSRGPHTLIASRAETGFS